MEIFSKISDFKSEIIYFGELKKRIELLLKYVSDNQIGWKSIKTWRKIKLNKIAPD